MAVGDITIVEGKGASTKYLVDDRDTSGAASAIRAGEFCKTGATDSQFVVPLVDADLTIGTDQPLHGLAVRTSTETATANGEVEVIVPDLYLLYSIRALTASLVDTQSEIDALRGESDILDLTNSNWRMDTAAGSGANNAFKIEGGDPTHSSLTFSIRIDATFRGRARV